MHSSDLISVFHWWFVILIIGTGFLPLTVVYFSSFFDKGYIFSKLIGIAVSSYAVFLLGILHLVPFGQISSFIIFLLTAAAIYYFLPMKDYAIKLIKKHWRVFVFEEILFLIAILFWAAIHSFNPDIHGLEKYMDYGFINSILRADYFPPKDMWLPPYPINYYYYGHYITAFLIKLSGVAPALAFNIMLSTIFAWCFTQTFSIGANLFIIAHKKLSLPRFKFKYLFAGILTAALVTFAGNFHIIYAFFKPYEVDNPKPVWELPFTFINQNYNPKDPQSSLFTFPNGYWYPNATRYIYHTIHEFPIYSWVVADLHGHVLDIPYVLLLIGLMLAIFVKADPFLEDKESGFFKSFKTFTSYFIIHPFTILLIGFLLAIMYMTNAWDGAIYIMLTSLVIFYILWERGGVVAQPAGIHNKLSKKISPGNFKILFFFVRLLVPVLLVATSFLVFSFPYNHYFKPFVSGIGVLCAPQSLTKIGKLGPLLFEADHCQHSYWWELLMLYGFFYLFAFSFLLFLSRAKKVFRIDIFILVLIILSTFLIILPEFIYIKDIYPAHFRANTMFKLVFQAFIMLSIASGYIIVRLLQTRLRLLFFIISVISVSLVLTYPYLAIGSYYGDIRNYKNYKGLDGILYLKTLYPADYAAINWLNTHIKGQPVILEAQGDSYTDYARISANTGLPTVLGWTVHEWLWRGSYDIPAMPSGTPQKVIDQLKFYYPAPRITDVTNLYESKDLNLTKQLITKYKVNYVYIGDMEHQKYPNLNEDKFTKLGKVIFRKDKTKIYEIKI